ncbi:hypothetical protein DC090_07605 [Trueperella pyogenes]|nr:hypothetical protein DC090_07605 [Trueperella pyogenes]AWG17031.1 hypothetical protein DDE06_09535 [Trueperella pyogenes]AZR04023.1 hypothetical protein EBQ11_01350 [Trueperella pyogenes]
MTRSLHIVNDFLNALPGTSRPQYIVSLPLWDYMRWNLRLLVRDIDEKSEPEIDQGCITIDARYFQKICRES